MTQFAFRLLSDGLSPADNVHWNILVTRWRNARDKRRIYLSLYKNVIKRYQSLFHFSQFPCRQTRFVWFNLIFLVQMLISDSYRDSECTLNKCNAYGMNS